MTPFNPGAGLGATRNAAGEVEFFSIGSDQALYNYLADTAADTGYVATPVGVFAQCAAVAADASGAILIFAAEGTRLTMVTEQLGHAQRWSAPLAMRWPLPPGARHIAALHTAQAGDTCYLAMLVETDSLAGPAAYRLVILTLCDDEPAEFQDTGLTLHSLCCTWVGETAATMRFVCVQADLVSVSAVTGVATHQRMATASPAVAIAGAVDAWGRQHLFAVLRDGNAYRLDAGGRTNDTDAAVTWRPLTTGQCFSSIAAQADHLGAIHLVAQAADRLCHLRPDPTSPIGYADPQPVLGGVAAFALAANDDGDIQVLGGHATALHSVTWHAGAARWHTEPVELAAGALVDEHSAYLSELQFRSPQGAPLAGLGVAITASRPTTITVQGARYVIDAQRAAHVATNAIGSLSVHQPANALAAATLLLHVPGRLPPDEVLVLSPDTALQARLAALTGEGLLAARTDTGMPLLPAPHRQPAQADAAAMAVAQVMVLATSTDAAAFGPVRASIDVLNGLRRVNVSDARLARRLDTAMPQAWRFSTADGAARFELMAPTQAHQHLDDLRAASFRFGGFIAFVHGLSDIVQRTAQGLFEIHDVTLSPEHDQVQVAVQFVVDDVRYLYETRLETIDHLYDLVEVVFAQVQVHFTGLHGWLGSHTDWAAVARTTRALAYTATQFLGFFQGAVSGMRDHFEQGLAPLQAALDDLFGQAIDGAGAARLGGPAPTPVTSDPRVLAALSNNPLVDAILERAGALTAAPSPRPGAAAQRIASPWASIESAVRSCAQSITRQPEFEPLQQHFVGIGAAQADLLGSSLAEMLHVVRDLVKASLAGLKPVVDELLRQLRSMVSAFNAGLHAPWRAASLQPLFGHMAPGLSMNTLNVAAAALAIPATRLYQSAYGRPPFENDDELTAFEHAWDANTLLRASGLRGPSALGSQRALMRVSRLGSSWTGLLPPKAAPVIALVGALAPHLQAVLAAGASATHSPNSPAASGDAAVWSDPQGLAQVTSALIGQAARCPWFFAAGGIGRSREGAGYLEWTYANLGVALELLWLVDGRSIPDEAQSVVTHLYGNVHLALATLASRGQPAQQVASHLLALVPETGRILRFSPIVEATQGHSLQALQTLDAVCRRDAAVNAASRAMARHLTEPPHTPGMASPAAAVDGVLAGQQAVAA
ncbi:hypothetical protein AACH06_01745 [Ideonella sp. DXS29W]|uniref:Uncharacterized protein n=1 Tax=Ideonella lacteola TaxID=2984193 RepID=A0ABU9BHV7_9BURK